jgi:GcrA cell cycle regulator
MMFIKWPPEKVALLRELWPSDLKFSEIVSQIGLSRGAVAGKANRLQLPARPARGHRDPTARKEPPREQGAPKQMFDLGPHECRFPIGDPKEEGFGFCGHRTPPGQSYCEHHHGIAYLGRAAR